MNMLPLYLLLSLLGGEQALKVEMTTFKLDNGLQVIISEDHRVPTVGVALLYKVGSRNETPKEYGFAHLFEHMMFQGSTHVGKMEHFALVNNVGGKLNAFTTKEFTLYYEVLPSNNLELGLWLEADRMIGLKVNQDNLTNQKETVIEEMKQRYDNQPYGMAYLEINKLAFKNPEYSHGVIGEKKLIRETTLEMVQGFHKKYYLPNNAILVVTGDITPAQARALVIRYFSGVKEGDSVDPPEVKEPTQTAYREHTIIDDKAKLPALYMAWHIPAVSDVDYYAVDVLVRVLFSGKSARLYQKLVKKEELAVNVSGWVEGHKGPDLMMASAILNEPDYDTVVNFIEDELIQIADEGVTKEELDKVLKTVRAEFISNFKSNLSRAMQVAYYTFLFDDHEAINKELAKYKAVTVEDIKKAAATYGVHKNLSVLKVKVADKKADKKADGTNTSQKEVNHETK